MHAKKKKRGKILKRPKLRYVWGLNPKTRVKPSKKVYRRSKEKQKKGNWSKEST